MLPIAIPRKIVRQRRRGRDRDLGQIRRDREQDHTAKRLAEPQPAIERIRRMRQLDPRHPNRHRRRKKDQDERGKTETGEHTPVSTGARHATPAA